MGPVTDSRRLSPQTTSSSGYHSDLSLSNESPKSIPNYLQIDKKLNDNKNLSRITNFIRKQYERAKAKLIPQKPIKTCSKATSTTPLSYLKPSSCSHKQSSFIEPIYSVYVQPIYDNYKPPLLRNSSYRHTSNPRNNPNPHRCHSYSIKPTVCQSYYPYKYLEKHYGNYNRLSDFLSTTNSAFKPIKSSRHFSDQLPPSDDPCDLEVAQYFHKTPQWTNRNYYDIYTNNNSIRKNYIETLC